MPASAVVKVKQDSTITLQDGTGAPVELVITYDPKTFSCDEVADLHEEVAIYAGRTYLGSRKGAAKPVGFSFECYVTSFTSAETTDTEGNPLDFIRRVNGFSANLNAGTASYDFPMCGVVLTMEGTELGDLADSTLTFAKCALSFSFSADEPNKFAVTGTCRGGLTYV